jgi:hypothetical protein
MHAFRWTVAYVPLLFYLAAFFVASYFSGDMGRSFTKSLATAYLVGLAVLAINLVDCEKRMRMSIAAWLVGAAIPVGVGIFTIVLYYASPTSSLLPYLTYHYGSVPVGPYPRLSSTSFSEHVLQLPERNILLLWLNEHWDGSAIGSGGYALSRPLSVQSSRSHRVSALLL